ncbi:hypothetical protein T4B_12789 [Trichinella pseudospiralis]|uniref:Uncharacterized protein n=1 Tax=Trichinella pseudospiralis TaxID=6337 RepID=A0A0V1K8V6_TRIPS|nr:hypothetical protein T4E_9661 [Trichinella pseudospiralis]KRY75616.1 hypothetical protein T4A_7389 [Trichinella pseudospiralis]KRZ29478.1 hypothetical protein T4B_12789 [Trichinella pseudospiralis]KRZ43611.1 hypothetical protein T4C_10756 [Trichinella pseudospiralis]
MPKLVWIFFTISFLMLSKQKCSVFADSASESGSDEVQLVKGDGNALESLHTNSNKTDIFDGKREAEIFLNNMNTTDEQEDIQATSKFTERRKDSPVNLYDNKEDSIESNHTIDEQHDIQATSKFTERRKDSSINLYDHKDELPESMYIVEPLSLDDDEDQPIKSTNSSEYDIQRKFIESIKKISRKMVKSLMAVLEKFNIVEGKDADYVFRMQLHRNAGLTQKESNSSNAIKNFDEKSSEN